MNLRETPTDSYGMPLLILDPHDVPARMKNRHHLWHPDVELSSDSDADRALRYSVVQKLSKSAHKYYHCLFSGPPLPDTDEKKFFLTVLGRSGYMSEDGIDLKKPDATPLPLIGQDRKRLIVFPDYARKGPDGQDYKTRRTGMFLAQYAISQDLGHLGNTIDEFLHTNDPDMRLALGSDIIDEGIRVAVDPFVELFSQALKEHRIRGKVTHPFEVVRNIFPDIYNEGYIDSLTANLQAA